MYFNKYYNATIKKYTTKIVISENELRTLKEIIKEDMTDINYNDMDVKRFKIENEMKLKKDKSYIGDEAIENIEDDFETKYYIIELTQEQFDKISEQSMHFLVNYKQWLDRLKDINLETTETMHRIVKDYEKITNDLLDEKYISL